MTNTRSGAMLEFILTSALSFGAYQCARSVHVGQRLGSNGRHYVDVIGEKNGCRFLVSAKWQQVAGTAEQKIPFELMRLMDALSSNEFTKAYLVLGGEGWTLRDFYVSGGLDTFFKIDPRIEILTLEAFLTKANRGEL